MHEYKLEIEKCYVNHSYGIDTCYVFADTKEEAYNTALSQIRAEYGSEFDDYHILDVKDLGKE